MHATDLGLNLSLMNQILPCMQASNRRRRKFKVFEEERKIQLVEKEDLGNGVLEIVKRNYVAS
jgi:hypothetical protein